MTIDVLLCSGILLAMVIISSFAQILLKKAAGRQYPNLWKRYLNWRVIFSYIIFILVTSVSMLTLRVLPLTHVGVLETSGYVFVPLISFLLLKEKISRKKCVGIAMVVLGVVIFIQ